jgi:hypothetical protein
MPSLELAQASLAPETQKALSLPTALLIFGAVSQAETLMEIVDRVCDRYFCGAVKDSKFEGRLASSAGGANLVPGRDFHPQSSSAFIEKSLLNVPGIQELVFDTAH